MTQMSLWLLQQTNEAMGRERPSESECKKETMGAKATWMEGMTWCAWTCVVFNF